MVVKNCSWCFLHFYYFQFRRLDNMEALQCFRKNWSVVELLNIQGCGYHCHVMFPGLKRFQKWLSNVLGVIIPLSLLSLLALLGKLPIRWLTKRRRDSMLPSVTILSLLAKKIKNTQILQEFLNLFKSMNLIYLQLKLKRV
jgi:hypothetical protein